MTAVIMPGCVLGDGAVLGAIAAADVGQELAGGTLHMGVPAIATTKHQCGARPRRRPVNPAHMRCASAMQHTWGGGQEQDTQVWEDLSWISPGSAEVLTLP